MQQAQGNRLGDLIARASTRPMVNDEAADEETERCELCSEPLFAEHRHLLDLSERNLCCVCRGCSILFDQAAAGGGHYSLVPDRRWLLENFQLDEPAWESLRIPVEVAFFFHDSTAGRVVAYYPSPAGAVESLLELATWSRIVRENSVLEAMAGDVEALLVNRSGAAGEHFLVPIDDCYELVGLIRTRWTGFTGGKEVWDEIEQFFTALRKRARPVAPWSAREGLPEPDRAQHDI